jgi:hypothetical protein
MWQLGPYNSTETECGMLDRKLANMTIGILVKTASLRKTQEIPMCLDMIAENMT